jgi:hypothetical protein
MSSARRLSRSLRELWESRELVKLKLRQVGRRYGPLIASGVIGMASGMLTVHLVREARQEEPAAVRIPTTEAESAENTEGAEPEVVG